MGLRMGRNLAKKLPNSGMYIYDVSAKAVDEFKASTPQAILCSSAKEVAEKADVIFSIVPESSHVRAVYLAPETGIINANLDGKLLFELSTIDMETTRDIGEKILSKHPGASYYDAPVSGGDTGADAGTLTIMVGCSESDKNWPQIQEILSTMGKDIIACGGLGNGLIVKICNNYCSSIITIATTDTFNMAIRAGMDPLLLQKIFKTSTCANSNCQVMNPVPGLSPKAPSSNGYKGGFRVQYMLKDVGLALGLARTAGVTLALGNMSLGVYQGASLDPRCRDLDSKVVYRYLGGPEDWKKYVRKSS
ncbi:hypothetical protein NW754_001475 [Fusarium falciforme]|nr:hypothetical protein NW754_001475 [Fusarium falciforme]